jgi:hypothetical protein
VNSVKLKAGVMAFLFFSSVGKGMIYIGLSLPSVSVGVETVRLAERPCCGRCESQ